MRQRSLNQLARELVLAQSSDWAFLITVGTAMQYSTKRTKEHIQRFNDLYGQIKDDRIDEEFLRDLEWRDNIFPQIDYRIYNSENIANIEKPKALV